METPPTPPRPASLSVPPASVPGALGLVLDPAVSEERRKWREKGKIQRARKKAVHPGSSPLAQNGEALPAPAPGTSAVSEGDVSLVPVPWNPDRLRKLWEQLVPAAEKWDVESLKASALKVDACLVAMVEKEAPWNPVSKLTLVETGPQVTADILNACGIGADRADLVGLVMAAWCIYSGRAVVADKLEKMATEKAERAEREKKTQRQEREAG